MFWTLWCREGQNCQLIQHLMVSWIKWWENRLGKTQKSSVTELGMPGGGICPLQPLLPEELLAHLRRCQRHWGGLDQVQGIHCASGSQELWSEDYRCLLLGSCCSLVGSGSAEAVDSYCLVRRAAQGCPGGKNSGVGGVTAFVFLSALWSLVLQDVYPGIGDSTLPWLLWAHLLLLIGATCLPPAQPLWSRPGTWLAQQEWFSAGKR